MDKLRECALICLRYCRSEYDRLIQIVNNFNNWLINSDSDWMIAMSYSTDVYRRWFCLSSKCSPCWWWSSIVAYSCHSSVVWTLYEIHQDINVIFDWKSFVEPTYLISVAIHAKPCVWIQRWKIPKPPGIYWKRRQNPYSHADHVWMWLQFRWSKTRPSQ